MNVDLRMIRMGPSGERHKLLSRGQSNKYKDAFHIVSFPVAILLLPHIYRGFKVGEKYDKKSYAAVLLFFDK